MDGMNIIAGVAHAEAVALALLQVISRIHVAARKSYAVDRPLIETPVCGIPFGKGHFNHFVRLGGNSIRLGETRIVPVEWLGRRPDWLSFVPGVFDDDAHAVTAIVVGKVSHDP